MNKTALAWEISADKKWQGYTLREILFYKELLFRFVRRDVLSTYQQTLLGRFWIFLQPLLTSFVYVIVFGSFIKTSPNGIPQVLFYLTGTIIWSFFSDSLTGTMYTFTSNAQIFSKVYFPRIISPLSTICTQFIRLGIQVALFFTIYFLYTLSYPNLLINTNIYMIPLMLLFTSAFALGLGLIFSVLIAKYRDFENIIQFGLRLFMFASPVLYSSAVIPSEFSFIYWLNPLTTMIETFRSAFLTQQYIPQIYYVITAINVTLMLVVGLILFKRQEQIVMDTI